MKPLKRTRVGPAQKRIFIVDDHPVTRRGLSQLIEHEPELTVCGEAENARQALTTLKPPLPDLILCDITMPGCSGLELIKDVKLQHPELFVLVMSMHDENIYAERALRAGAHGYIMKSEGGEMVLEAVRQVLRGEIYVSKKISTSLLNLLSGRSLRRKETKLGALTNREFGVFELIGQGLSTRVIGQRLHISGKTVETHRMHLKEKLQLKTSAELVAYAVRWGAANQLI